MWNKFNKIHIFSVIHEINYLYIKDIIILWYYLSIILLSIMENNNNNYVLNAFQNSFKDVFILNKILLK